MLQAIVLQVFVAELTSTVTVQSVTQGVWEIAVVIVDLGQEPFDGFWGL